MARDASRPDALRRQRRAGAVKDAEGTAKRRELKATVLEGSRAPWQLSTDRDYPPPTVQILLDSNFRARILFQNQWVTA